MKTTSIQTKKSCYHCGDDCDERPIGLYDKPFCCDGCEAVYQLLQENELCTYYDLDQNPGFKIKANPKEQFAYLDNEQIVTKLLDYEEGNTAKIRLYIPKIHCSSCIWLLENIYKIEKGILSSRIHFLKKEIDLVFQQDKVSLRHIVEVLDSLGYTPELHLDSYNKVATQKEDKSLYFKIGISGFCASNIMMLSFPEYFGMDGLLESQFSYLFTYLNLLFSLPVILYAASDYYISAWKGLANRMLNLDVPIALGTTAVFLRSVYEVLTNIGPGYFDSLTGLVFFLLIGKWIQSRTYKHFSFERDYQSYLPIAVTKLEKGQEYPFPIQDLKVEDSILVRQNEIIPADALLECESTSVDYSFVTGESQPISKQRGDLLYAGGKVVGKAIQLRVKKEVSNSYLLQLWNQQVFIKPTNAFLSSFVLSFSSYFVLGTLLITATTGVYWWIVDPSKLLFSTTAVLLVACPCALALSLPFAFGNCLRLLSKKGLFLKNADTVEKLAEIDTVVFDKTGTLTKAGEIQVEFVGRLCTNQELSLIRTAAGQSMHPLSKSIYTSLKAPLLKVASFLETQGKGITVQIDNTQVRIGSPSYMNISTEGWNESRVYVEIHGELMGYFIVTQCYRQGWTQLLKKLKSSYHLHLLSGDNDGQMNQFNEYIPKENRRFFQMPLDKLEYIQKLQREGHKVLMVGDGLNDAGALKAADIGISVAEDVYRFIPACDGICEAESLIILPAFLKYAKQGVGIVKMSLVISLFYNAVGLYYAVQGTLSPLIAAILMPLSSVSIVLFAVVFTSFLSKTIK